MANHSRISSRQNPRVKDAVRLRTGRERVRTGCFLIDGPREIARARAAHVRCVEVFVCEELCDSPEARAALELLRGSGAELLSVTPEVYEKLAFGDRKDGLVMVAEAPRRSLHNISLPAAPLVAVLEGIEKPGNLGAILRSADAAGVDAVLVAGGRTDLYNPNTIRASLGTVFRENVCAAAVPEVLNWLRNEQFQIVAARPDAELIYSDADLHGRVAIVLGSEAHGLTQAWQAADITPVRLPMHGLADSLNVSTTAAVLFYEALRQRSTGDTPN